MKRPRLEREILLLAILAVSAIGIHGYHLGSDDAAIYVPAIEKVADPALFPFHSEFFLQHAHLSLFSNLVGDSARFTGLSTDWTIFLWHGISVFLLLWAGLKLLRVCFSSPRAQWAGVGLLAATLSVPVAGTALVIMDPYLTARSLSTPAMLFAMACFAQGEPRRGLLWLLFTVLIHPQMGVYGAAFLCCLALVPRLTVPLKQPKLAPTLASLSVVPWGLEFAPAHGIYREVLYTRSYFFVSRWEWWEWVGVLAPLLLFYWFWRKAPGGTSDSFRRMSAALVFFGVAATAGGVMLSSSRVFEGLARLQPMRSFHLLYVVLFLFLGGLAGEYVLKNRVWRWCCLFVPLAGGMWTLQAQTYIASAHVEWPGQRSHNGWVSAFEWIRQNTPKNAEFALDPDYMAVGADDQHGFRAVAERSALADNLKDSGAVSLFPQLANEWKDEVNAQKGWRQFGPADYRRLATRYGVNWVVLEHAQSTDGLACPYHNIEVSVCQVSPTVGE